MPGPPVHVEHPPSQHRLVPRNRREAEPLGAPVLDQVKRQVAPDNRQGHAFGADQVKLLLPSDWKEVAGVEILEADVELRRRDRFLLIDQERRGGVPLPAILLLHDPAPHAEGEVAPLIVQPIALPLERHAVGRPVGPVGPEELGDAAERLPVTRDVQVLAVASW